MAQEQAKEEPKGLFTSIFDGVKNVGSSVVDGVGKVSRSFHPKLGMFALWRNDCHGPLHRLGTWP